VLLEPDYSWKLAAIIPQGFQHGVYRGKGGVTFGFELCLIRDVVSPSRLPVFQERDSRHMVHGLLQSGLVLSLDLMYFVSSLIL
jgi:hypothetical protein